MVNSNIKDSLQGNILPSENPFHWSSLEGSHTFQNNGYTLKLNNSEIYMQNLPIELSDNSGHLHFIVKNDVEIDVAIWTNRNGYFSGIENNAAYNLEVDSALFDIQDIGSEADSFIKFTMRPNSMLALDVQGDNGRWHRSGSRFDQLATQRGIAAPNGKSFLAVLTNPNRVFDSGETQTITVNTLDYNRYDQDFYIEITGARRVNPRFEQREGWSGVDSDQLQGFETSTSGQPQYVDPTDWQPVTSLLSPFGIATTGQDALGNTWEVKLMQKTTGGDMFSNRLEYGVFVDGVLQSETVTDDYIIARAYFDDYVAATNQQGQNRQDADPPELIDFDKLKLGLGLGFAGIVIILILVIAARRS